VVADAVTIEPASRSIGEFRTKDQVASSILDASSDDPVLVPRRGLWGFRRAVKPPRVTLAVRLAGKTAAETISVMLAVFARIEPALRKSITFDNDTAFAQHALLRTMRAMTTWFCDAYASWQKGGVENANGRLRRWLPRQIDIDKLSDEEIQDIVITANLTPFWTSFQGILKELGKDVQIRFA
jgi:IS30 family transposase